MKRVVSILKINLLSLIALPLFLLSVGVKLLAKAAEKLIVGVVVILVLLLAMLVAAAIQNPEEIFDTLFMMILLLVLGGIITALFIVFFSVISAIVMVVAGVIIGVLNMLYELLYAGYAALYQKCKASYEYELGEGNPFFKGLACVFYSILRAVNAVVIFLVIHSMKLMAAACILLVGGTLLALNQKSQTVMGINLFTFLGMFPVSDIIAGAILYLAFIGGISAILLSLGLEWNEWGEEMQMATSDYSADLSGLPANWGSLNGSGESGTEDEAYRRCNEYMDILNRHFQELEGFQTETMGVIRSSENQVLSSRMGEYLGKLQELGEKMNSFSNMVPIAEFEKLIPQIKRLESLKEDILKMNARLASFSPKEAGTGFFAGCSTREKLEKRYKALCKTYHPDTEAGDEETFKKMQEEYERLKEKLG